MHKKKGNPKRRRVPMTNGTAKGHSVTAHDLGSHESNSKVPLVLTLQFPRDSSAAAEIAATATSSRIIFCFLFFSFFLKIVCVLEEKNAP